MTFIKRRQRLIDRLGNIYDEDLLDKIEEIIDEKSMLLWNRCRMDKRIQKRKWINSLTNG